MCLNASEENRNNSNQSALLILKSNQWYEMEAPSVLVYFLSSMCPNYYNTSLAFWTLSKRFCFIQDPF